MAEAKIQERVEAVFSRPETETYSGTYLTELLSTWRDTEKTSSRSVTLLVLTSAAAILVARHQVSEISLSVVKVTDTRWLMLTLPIVVAYLYSTVWTIAAESSMVESTYCGLTNVLWKPVYQADLERPLYPANMSVLATEKLTFVLPENTRTRQLVNAAGMVRVGILMLGPIAVEGYLYYRAYSEFGATSALLWLSAAASLVLLLAGGAYLAAAYAVAE